MKQAAVGPSAGDEYLLGVSGARRSLSASKPVCVARPIARSEFGGHAVEVY